MRGRLLLLTGGAAASVTAEVVHARGVVLEAEAPIVRTTTLHGKATLRPVQTPTFTTTLRVTVHLGPLGPLVTAGVLHGKATLLRALAPSVAGVVRCRAVLLSAAVPSALTAGVLHVEAAAAGALVLARDLSTPTFVTGPTGRTVVAGSSGRTTVVGSDGSTLVADPEG